MTDRTIDFILNLQNIDGAFRFHPTGSATLLSTCFAVQALFLLDKIDLIDREMVSNYLLAQQRRDGIFCDPVFDVDGLSGLQSRDYIEWQFTYFALIALDMLGSTPEKKIYFIEPFQDLEILKTWLDKRNWNDFWYSSNEIMFLMYFLSHVKRDAQQYSSIDESLDFIFRYLDLRQDPTTGYWGNEVRSNPRNGLFGAAHIYLFYEYYGKTINFGEAIVESTLKLQQEDGLYGPAGGGACEDYDAIEVLARLRPLCSEMDDRIHSSMLCTLNIINSTKSVAGGFGYRLSLPAPMIALKRKINRILRRTKYRYSGWDRMECDMYSPDIWGTYFRLLTIAIVEINLDLPKSYPYRSYSLPGWGYLGKNVRSPNSRLTR